MNFSAKYRSRSSSCEIYETIEARAYKEAQVSAMKNPWVERGIWEFVGFEDPDTDPDTCAPDVGCESRREGTLPRRSDEMSNSAVTPFAAKAAVFGVALVVVAVAVALLR